MEELSPDEKQRMIIAMRSIAISHSTHSGPLPAPEALKEYNDIIPDGANRIMNLTEQQSAHRMEIEKVVILSNSRESSRGQLFGFVLALIGILCSSFLILIGREVSGSIIFGTTLLGMVTVFVIGKKSQSDSSEE